MRRLTIAALALAASVSCAQAGTYDIINDPGGNVAEYYIRAGQFARQGVTVRVFGSCKSACTLYLARANVCAGPGASFWFHQASNQAGTTFMMRVYPGRISNWIRSKGGLKPSWHTLKGPALRKLVRPCAT